MLTSYHQGNCHFSLNRENVVKIKKSRVVEEPQEKPKKKRRKKS